MTLGVWIEDAILFDWETPAASTQAVDWPVVTTQSFSACITKYEMSAQ